MPPRQVRIVVNIDLDYFCLAFECLRQFIQNRRKPLAMSSPGSEKFDQYRTLKIHYFPLKRGFRCIHGPAGIQRDEIEMFLAFPAFERFLPPVQGYAVLRAAFRTHCNNFAHASLLVVSFNTRRPLFQSWRECLELSLRRRRGIIVGTGKELHLPERTL